MITAPSTKSLVDAFRITKREADAIRAVIKGDRLPDDMRVKVAPVVTEYPARSGRDKMEAINAIIDGSGVEYLPNGLGSYVNTGDAYSPTIVRVGFQRYRLTTWGDVVEAAERRAAGTGQDCRR